MRVKTAMSTQLRATWHTDSLDLVVLPSTGALRYHNCCIDGSTSPENFGYHLVYEMNTWWVVVTICFPSLLEIFKDFNQIYNCNLELKIVIQIY